MINRRRFLGYGLGLGGMGLGASLGLQVAKSPLKQQPKVQHQPPLQRVAAR